MSARVRVVAVVVIFALLIAASAAYILFARGTQERALRTAPVQARAAVSDVQGRPHIVFRHTARGPDHGRVALVPLADPAGSRAVTDLSCERVHAAGIRTLCVGETTGMVPGYQAQVLTAGAEATELAFTGTPSRARLSADGQLAATTSFVAGDSYADDGFSTRTVVTAPGLGKGMDLEDFRLVHHGKAVRPVDRNYWGVTFASDDQTFYVTVAFGGQTWLARGSLSSRTISTLRSDAECPSLSPDQGRVAYKRLQGRSPGDWQVAVLDLASGQENVLEGTLGLDDQVEWLDDSRLLYGVPRADGVSSVLTSDVWVVAADGTAPPRVLVKDASSPAVLRQGRFSRFAAPGSAVP